MFVDLLIFRLFIKTPPRPECTPVYHDKFKKWNLVRDPDTLSEAQIMVDFPRGSSLGSSLCASSGGSLSADGATGKG